MPPLSPSNKSKPGDLLIDSNLLYFCLNNIHRMPKNSTCLTLIASFLLSLLSSETRCQIITTIASGTNINDGSSALQAAFVAPTSLAFDRKGNIFITDTEDQRIRKIDVNGVMSTLAGTGESGFGGDGGPATNARFLNPSGIAADDAGNVYVADFQNSRVRKIDTNGLVTTVAGTATAGFSGDGGPATGAQLNFPRCVVVDQDGNLYIADSNNNRIRKVSTNGLITTVAGNGVFGFGGDGGPAVNAQLRSPGAIAVDEANNLYIVDTYNYRIRKVDANGTIVTVAGNGAYETGGDGGPAANASLNTPIGVAVDGAGNLYIAQQDSRVRKVNTAGIISAVAGNGTNGFGGDGGLAVNALIGSSPGVKLDPAGNVYIADQNNYRIRRISPDGIITTVAGGFTGDGGPATNAFFRRLLFDTPANLTVDQTGNVYVMDRFANRVRKVSPSGIVTTAAGTGVNGYAGDGGPAISAQLRHPRDAGLDSLGNLYIADQYNSRIRKIDAGDLITTVAGNGTPYFIENRPGSSSADFYNTSGIAVSKAGVIYVATTNCILKIATTGIISIVAGVTASSGYSGDGGLATNAQLNNPTSVALDASGNLYIADFFNNRIRKVDTKGMISTVAGNGAPGYGGENVLAINSPVTQPYDVAVDAAGTIFISETGYARIRKVDRNGMMTTVAGNGANGFSGDGALAINAQLSNPGGIGLDAAGNLYIADTGNRRVRKVTYPIQPALTASSALNCSTTSVTLTATPSGEGFNYRFGAGAAQIGTTNRAVVSTAGVYSVTVTTPVFGSPAGSATVQVSAMGFYTVKPGAWNDPSVWACSLIPGAGQSARILHQIDLPPNYQAETRAIQYGTGGGLRFATGAKLRLMP